MIKRVLLVLLIVLLIAAALPYFEAPVYRFPEPRPFSGPAWWNPYDHLHGAWKMASLHAHGRAWQGLTNGRQTDEDVVKAYRGMGYDIAGVSDYHVIAAQAGVATMPLYEHGYNLGKIHQLAIGAHRVEWLDYPLFQYRSQKQFIINRLLASADLVAPVHPSGRDAYTAEDFRRLTGYQVFEVVNGPFVVADLWDAALSSGHAVWAIGSDDTHDITDPKRTAVAWTMIDAPSDSTADVIEALRAGRAYAVADLAEKAVADLAEKKDRSEETLAGVEVRQGALAVTSVGAPATFSFVGQNGRTLRTVEAVNTATYDLAPTDTYVRTVIRTAHTMMFINPIVRYDGVSLPAPVATIDPTRTWLLRFLLAAGCLIAVGVLWRPRR
jgi:hypothetical protein